MLTTQKVAGGDATLARAARPVHAGRYEMLLDRHEGDIARRLATG